MSSKSKKAKAPIASKPKQPPVSAEFAEFNHPLLQKTHSVVLQWANVEIGNKVTENNGEMLMFRLQQCLKKIQGVIDTLQKLSPPTK